MKPEQSPNTRPIQPRIGKLDDIHWIKTILENLKHWTRLQIRNQKWCSRHDYFHLQISFPTSAQITTPRRWMVFSSVCKSAKSSGCKVASFCAPTLAELSFDLFLDTPSLSASVRWMRELWVTFAKGDQNPGRLIWILQIIHLERKWSETNLHDYVPC